MPATNTLDLGGNSLIVSNLKINSDTPGLAATTSPSVTAGSGAPTASAVKGTLYIRLDGSSVATRMYVNTDGATTWTNFTTAA